MFNSQEPTQPHLGFLLLRDGHAVPLTGISPDELKAGAKHRVPHPNAEPLKHRNTLNAIVDRLGFRGDFGDFKNNGWDAFNKFLHENGCGTYAGLFPSDHGGCIDLKFRSLHGPTRRQLSDRIFESQWPIPKRVFLGYGVNWAAWDRGDGFNPPLDAVATIGGDSTTTLQRANNLFARRHDLTEQWGFIDDKLLWEPVQPLIDKTYWMTTSSEEVRQAHYTKVVEAVQAFRAVFDTRPEGWVDVLRYNERLVVLRAHDGAWDVLWRAYRDVEPPQPSDISNWSELAFEDMPASLLSKTDLERAVHFDQEVWEERDAHEAEQAFYDRGGTGFDRQLTSEVNIRIDWLREQRRHLGSEPTRWRGDLPLGFRLVNIGEQRLAVSELVDLAQFRQMLMETGYPKRRAHFNEPWERANEGEPPTSPVGANWCDAQAFCAWKERQLGGAVRLATKNELRALHPFYSDRYAGLSGGDFLWERFPPRPLVKPTDDQMRVDIPSAVDWSEPRFLEHGPDLPEFPPLSGIGGKSRKRWITDFPPQATWYKDLPWANYSGLGFIDAWDAYEWCQEPGWLHGRFWEGSIALKSWGAYKNMKVTFRLVLDLEV